MDKAAGGADCVPNINVRERRKRLVGGVAALALALAVLLALVALGTSPWWRVVLFPLFFATASGIFQWRNKT